MLANKANQHDIHRKLKEFTESGLTRHQFSQRHGIPLTTMDYWRRVASRKPRLAEVTVVDNKKVAVETNRRFTITLSNGRRIVSNWLFADVELTRLIRIVESA